LRPRASRSSATSASPPARATWTGGFKAVGKTAAEAMQIYEHVKALEAAGAMVVPARVASEIARHTTLFLMPMGAAQAVTHNICSPRTCSTTPVDISRATPRSITTSTPNSITCNASASPPSRISRRRRVRRLSGERHLVPITEDQCDAFLEALPEQTRTYA